MVQSATGQVPPAGPSVIDVIVEPTAESSPVARRVTSACPLVGFGVTLRPVTVGPPFGMLSVPDAVAPQLPWSSCART